MTNRVRGGRAADGNMDMDWLASFRRMSTRSAWPPDGGWMLCGAQWQCAISLVFLSVPGVPTRRAESSARLIFLVAPLAPQTAQWGGNERHFPQTKKPVRVLVYGMHDGLVFTFQSFHFKDVFESFFFSSRRSFLFASLASSFVPLPSVPVGHPARQAAERGRTRWVRLRRPGRDATARSRRRATLPLFRTDATARRRRGERSPASTLIIFYI